VFRRDKVKKFLVTLLFASILLPVIAIHAQEKVTVTWWATERGRDTAATRDLHYKLARAFEEANPDIQVALASIP
jgi:ABC-type glycerol-3-phosphate transport system substrate-binding protein